MRTGQTCDLLRHENATAVGVTAVYPDIITKLVNQDDNYRPNTKFTLSLQSQQTGPHRIKEQKVN